MKTSIFKGMAIMKKKTVQAEFERNKSFLRRHGGKAALLAANGAALLLSPYAACVVAMTSAASYLAYRVTKNKMTAQPEGAKPQGAMRKAANGVVISAATLATMAMSAVGSFHAATLMKHNNQALSADITDGIYQTLNGKAVKGFSMVETNNGDKAIKFNIKGDDHYAIVSPKGDAATVRVVDSGFIDGQEEQTMTVPSNPAKPIIRTARTLDI